MKSIVKFIHNLFVPHEENNFRAKALHTDFLSFYLILAIVLTFTVKHFNLTNILGFATDISVNKLYELTNSERQKDNLATLSYNDKLAVAAGLKAQDMFSNNYWAHYGPNGSTPWDFILKSGYQYEFAGENLAKNFLFSQGVMDGWMNSPTHRENILRKDYTEVGFAVVNGTLNNEPTTLVVQMFGKPINAVSIPIVQQFTPPAVKAEESQQAVIPTSIPQVLNQKTTIPNLILPTPSILKKTTKSYSLPWLNFSFNINVIFLSFLLIALILDLYFASRLNIFRISGKNIAHIIFVGFICIGLWLLTKGSIL
jgi:hypothetical protein